MAPGQESLTLDHWIRKPYYIFRPAQLARRVWRSLQTPPVQGEIRFPWGPSLVYSPHDEIGHALWTTGVYEIAVTEILWRLAEAGETVVDGGANIGYMTSVLASRVGPRGTVHAFEPHPELHRQLAAHITGWKQTLGWSHVRAFPVALSNRTGPALLYTDAGFEHNRGTASLSRQSAGATTTGVVATTLDEVIGGGQHIGVLKLDVEGHEHEALLGATELLGRGRIRDIVFESWSEPRATLELLEGCGYEVFRVWRGLLKPRLMPARGEVSDAFEPPTYLATRDAARCADRLKPIGWRSLTGA